MYTNILISNSKFGMFQQLLTNRITPSQMDFIAQLEDDDGYMSINLSIFLFNLVKKI